MLLFSVIDHGRGDCHQPQDHRSCAAGGFQLALILKQIGLNLSKFSGFDDCTDLTPDQLKIIISIIAGDCD